MTYRSALVLLCAAVCFPSGFNLLSTGYLAPRLSEDLSLPAGGLAPVFGASGLGNVLGALTFGPLADAWGRRRVVLVALFAAIPFLVWSASARSVTDLIYAQFLANFFLMGLLPIVLALAGELMPERLKTTLVMFVWMGFLAGTIVAGLVVASLAEQYGWRIAFVMDAVISLVVGLFAAVWLPESPTIIARRSAGAPRERSFPVWLLFREGRALLTILLWTMSLANLIALFFMNSWLPTVLYQAGIAERGAVVIAALLNVGALLGSIAIAELFDRRPKNHYLMLAAAYLLGGTCIVAVGSAGNHLALAALAVFLAGFFTNGAQSTANAIVVTLYPPAMRATGGSWAIGIGQAGQIVGSLIGGTLLAEQWAPAQILGTMAGWTAIAACSAVMIGTMALRRAHAES